MQQQNIIKTSMSYGLILGLIFSVNFYLSITRNFILSLLSYAVMLAILVLIYKISVRFRDKDCGGYISYSKSFSFLLLIFFFGSIISTFIKYIYFQYINPTYLESLLSDTLSVMEFVRFPLTEEMHGKIQEMLTPFVFSLQSFWINMLLACIIGVFMGFFVKKEKGIGDIES